MLGHVAASHLHEPQHRSGLRRQSHPPGPRRGHAVDRIGHHVPARDELVGVADVVSYLADGPGRVVWAGVKDLRVQAAQPCAGAVQNRLFWC
jgi:hypothetical protein